MNWWVGTSGYSYKEWKGIFYPDKLAAKDMLAYYATQLRAVEINNTFYRLPNAKTLASWSDQVSEGFRFAIKASRRITHFKRLKDTEEETGYLLRTTATLGEHLGLILFQLPPNLAKDTDRLRNFLSLIPPQTRTAFEFRHDSWLDKRVFDLLGDHDCALCCADVEDEANAGITSTGSWGYLRLRRAEYSDDELRSWVEQIMEQGWSDVFVFFKHEGEGGGPQLARRFVALTG